MAVPQGLLTISLGLAVAGRCLGEPLSTITDFDHTGYLQWSNSFASGSVTVERRGSLFDVPDARWRTEWVPVKHIHSGGQIASTQLPTSELAVAYYRLQAADDAHTPSGMSVVPGGWFLMGSPTFTDYGVYVSTFYIDRHELTKAEWDAIHDWAVPLGYDFSAGWTAEGPNHPVHTVNWFDCVKWCNARSQKEGLDPVYYETDARTTILKTGEPLTVDNNAVDWDANGDRLPTESEWEKAARGGLLSKAFPWGDEEPDAARANYNSNVGTTTNVGSYPPNGYGLYDMVGNVVEWCWDGYLGTSTHPAPGSVDPKGLDITANRTTRGGHWQREDPFYLRCSARQGDNADSANNVKGFRTVRR